MTEQTALPQIVLFKSICMEHGECWAAKPPYWTRHYNTKAKAAVAATKRKREMANAFGEQGDATS